MDGESNSRELIARELDELRQRVRLLEQIRIEGERSAQALGKEKDRAQKIFDVAEVILVIIGADETIQRINAKGCRILGYGPEEIVGMNWFDLCLPPDDREKTRRIFRRLMAGEVDPVEYVENLVCTREGAQRLIAWHNTIMKDEQGAIAATLSSGEDITERRKAEEQLRASLKEKEVLLKEIHHRVKNNLQIVSSLLDMTSLRTGSPEVIEVLAGARARVHAMAMVHTKLYESARFDRIDLSEHARSLVAQCKKIHGHKDHVQCVVDGSGIFLSMMQAVPCALVLNELITNAYKYAFPGERKGTIRIELALSARGRVSVSVEDDGVGMPETVEIEGLETLGLKLVKNLVETQLKGRLAIMGGEGTEVHFDFEAENEDDEGEAADGS